MEQMKKCPYCAEEILLEARKCKHCGEYLDKDLRSEAESQQVKVVAKEGCFLQSLNAGCAFAFGGILIIIVITLLSRC